MKKQLSTIKNNWLIIVLFFILILFLNTGNIGNLSSSLGSVSKGIGGARYDSDMAYMESSSPYVSNQDFAPEEEDRKITKTANIRTETERGKFESSEQTLKNIVSSSDSFILNENVNKYGTGRGEYLQGSYYLKVETTKYDSVISQLKDIGELNYFSENAQDITGQYTNTEINLELEKERLERYVEMYEEAKDIDDKITLNDRIFSQERTIKYLEDYIKNMDTRIEYSTVYFTMTEERSEYANIAIVKFSELVDDFVSSVNGLLVFVFRIIPWAVIILIAVFVWNKKKK
ncbi:DUF4349 domain-containing protein [Candidatus Woesearchaeota archaeon]|nr:DUF4349 domain-containing protein [Candidatus Woesearchaeota archaeon]